jgi:hypothetical protein
MDSQPDRQPNTQPANLQPANLPNNVQQTSNKLPPSDRGIIYVDCGNSHPHHRNYSRSSSGCGMLLTALLILLFLCLLCHIAMNMECVSGFFTPPEEEIMNELKNIPTIELPSLNHNAVELSLKDSFNNDLPNQTNPIPTDGTNYADVAADMALEKSVKDQHRQYINQREKYTGTASFNPERSDSQDIVTFVGLRRPSYLTKDGKSLVDPSARQVSTVIDPNYLSKPVKLSWN